MILPLLEERAGVRTSPYHGLLFHGLGEAARTKLIAWKQSRKRPDDGGGVGFHTAFAK